MRSQSPRTSVVPQPRFCLSVAAGRDAAELWLERPVMSLADWRDNRFTAHACGMGFTDMGQRRQAFNAAFERAIADAIVAVFVVEVTHG